MKLIRDFILNYDNLSANGEDRSFSILGDNGSQFRLEVKNELNQYYNFKTKLFSATKSDLKGSISGLAFNSFIKFPKVTDADKYDILLFATEDTEHASYTEARFNDGSIDINNCKGSNSKLLTKQLYQLLGVTLTISSISPNSLSGFSGVSHSNFTVTTNGKKPIAKIPFEYKVTAGTTHALKVDSPNPNIEEVIGFYMERTIGSAGVMIEDEDIWSAEPRSTNKVVDGDFSGGATNITMDDDVGSFWAVGDRVTGNAILDAKTGANAVTVTAINVGSNAKVFTLSESIAIEDDETLTFTEASYYRWPIDNILGIKKGTIALGTNVTSDTEVAPYETFNTINAGGINEFQETKVKKNEIESSDKILLNDIEKNKEVITRNATTLAPRSVSAGNVTFNKQQLNKLAGDTIKMFSWGTDAIEELTGWELEFSDVAVSVNSPTTTNTSGVSDNNIVAVASGDGIMDDVSTVSGIGIDVSSGLPTVTNIASYTGSTATLTLSSNQTIENGTTLTFGAAGKIVTISGNIEIKKVGLSHGSNMSLPNWNGTVYFDLEKILTGTDES